MALITFANQTGEIPLSDLDSNFSAVNAFVSTSGVVIANDQPNITSVGTLTSLTVAGPVTSGSITGTSLNITGNVIASNLNANGVVRSNGVSVNGNLAVSTTIVAQGNITGQYILGNGYYLTGITSGSSDYGNANVAAFLPTYTGNITAGNITITGTYRGNGAGITNILGSTVTGPVANAAYATTAGTTTATSLPNLTQVGTLTSLTVNGTVSSGAIASSGNVAAQYFIGDGRFLTNIPGGNSTYGNANVAAYLPTYRGTLTGVTITGSNFSGSGAGLVNIQGATVTGTVANAAYATTAGTTTATSLPNLTRVGTLTGLTVNGTISSGTIASSGNVAAQYFIGDGRFLTNIPSGNSTYGNANVAAYLPTYRGTLTGVTINSSNFLGNGAGLVGIQGSTVTGIVANAAYATQAATVTTSAQPAITSVGTLTSLNVVGNVSTTGKYLGDGSGLTKILVSDVSRTVYVNNYAPGNTAGNVGDIWYQTY